MKKFIIIVILFLLGLGNTVQAQESNGLFIIIDAQKFTINETSEAKQNGCAVRYTFNGGEYFKDSIITFKLYLSTREYDFWNLWHFYRIKPKAHETDINPQDQHKTFLKDCSFLNTVDCLYWDDVKDLSWGDAKDYIGPLLFHKMPDGKKIKRTIYVVDLAEKYPNGKIKLYQVQDMNKEWSRTIFIDENDKQEWVKHTKTVREKIDKRRVERKAKPFRK